MLLNLRTMKITTINTNAATISPDVPRSSANPVWGRAVLNGRAVKVARGVTAAWVEVTNGVEDGALVAVEVAACATVAAWVAVAAFVVEVAACVAVGAFVSVGAGVAEAACVA